MAVENKRKAKPKGAIRFSITLSDEQKKAKTQILKHPYNFVVGKAGSGKTFLACAEALRLIKRYAKYKKIVIVKYFIIIGKRIKLQ